MRNHRALSPSLAACFAAFVCLLALAAGARAQPRPPAGPPENTGRNPMVEVRSRQQREAMLRNTEMLRASKPGSSRSFEAAAEQVREDFRRIQLLRNNVARHVLSGRPLDYKFIAGEAEEINKRAGRLKSHLVREAAPEEKKEERQHELADADVRDALVRMCQRIDSFTESPVFKTLDVVDVEQSAKAGRDLLDVIQLSGDIRRAAERLRKTARK
ncbi:MAG TPA: hypothetical protein VN228_18265 [Pyrinomonadaceae bacterium]|nr:hypothetical protein [Pyrinomonadaceae bacterium]